MSTFDTPDPYQSMIDDLLRRRGNLASRVGPLNVPFAPLQSRPSPLQMLLRGAVSGFNAQADAKQTALSNLLRLQESRRLHDAQIGNYGADNARADAALESMKAQRDWAREHGDASEERLNRSLEALEKDRALRHGETGQRITLAFDANAMARDRLRMSHEREARRAAASEAYAKLSPALKYRVDHAESIIAAKQKADPAYDPAPDFDKLDAQILEWSKQAGAGASDPFGQPVAPGIGQGPAPIPPVAGGARAAAGIPGDTQAEAAAIKAKMHAARGK